MAHEPFREPILAFAVTLRRNVSTAHLHRKCDMQLIGRFKPNKPALCQNPLQSDKKAELSFWPHPIRLPQYSEPI